MTNGVVGALRLPQRNGRLSESVQAAIKQYVLDQRLRPNDLLPPEGRLAEELGVSRTSVREAVKALESIGLLEARPGVGLVVRPFSLHPILDNLAYSILFDHSTVVELLDVREGLEAVFVKRVAATMTPDHLRVLRSVVDRMGERAAQGQTFPEEDRFFHRLLYRQLGNDLLLKLLDVFWEVWQRLREEVMRPESFDPIRTWEGHRRIVEALERRDGAAARRAVVAHFEGTREQMRAAGTAGEPQPVQD
jgi:DNA-binding FadR family transcriptional regulator